MTINTLLDELKNQPNANRLPEYIKVSGISDSQLVYDGKTQNAIYKWGIVEQDEHWFYFETDADRGYISYKKTFNTEKEALEHAKHILTRRAQAFSNNKRLDMAARYIRKTCGCLEERSYELAYEIAKYEDIFEDFFYYIRFKEYNKDDGIQIAIQGITAEKLELDYKMSPVEAYICLKDLRENPEETLQKIR